MWWLKYGNKVMSTYAFPGFWKNNRNTNPLERLFNGFWKIQDWPHSDIIQKLVVCYMRPRSLINQQQLWNLVKQWYLQNLVNCMVNLPLSRVNEGLVKLYGAAVKFLWYKTTTLPIPCGKSNQQQKRHYEKGVQWRNKSNPRGIILAAHLTPTGKAENTKELDKQWRTFEAKGSVVANPTGIRSILN